MLESWILRYKSCQGNVKKGIIIFNISNTTDVVPDISAGGTCPTTLGVIIFQGQNDSNPACPVLVWPPPKPEECAFEINSDVAKQVSSAAANKTEYKAQPGQMTRSAINVNRSFQELLALLLKVEL
jgi:hypothetical protein